MKKYHHCDSLATLSIYNDIGILIIKIEGRNIVLSLYNGNPISMG